MADQDSLLRLFNSEHFDEFLALSHIYRKPSGGVHEYLCNRLFDLPDEALERYLSQFCELAVNGENPSASLQRLLVEVCGRSLHIALKVFWLLRTMSQNARIAGKGIELLMEACSSTAQSVFLPPLPLADTSARHTDPGTEQTARARAAQRPWTAAEVRATDHPDAASTGVSASAGEVGVGPGHDGSPQSGRGDADAAGADADPMTRLSELRSHLGGEGEGVTALLKASLDDLSRGGSGIVSRSPPMDAAPACFRASVGFVDRLGSAASALIALPRFQRAAVLQSQLVGLNNALQEPEMTRRVLWPMDAATRVVLRVVPERATILNSRERAPFLLFVETEERPTAEVAGHAPPERGVATTASLPALRVDVDDSAFSAPSGARARVDQAALAACGPSEHRADVMPPRTPSHAAPGGGAHAEGSASSSESPTGSSVSSRGGAAAPGAGGGGPAAPARRMNSEDALRDMATSMHVTSLPEPPERGLRMSLTASSHLSEAVPGSARDVHGGVVTRVASPDSVATRSAGVDGSGTSSASSEGACETVPRGTPARGSSPDSADRGTGAPRRSLRPSTQSAGGSSGSWVAVEGADMRSALDEADGGASASPAPGAYPATAGAVDHGSRAVVPQNVVQESSGKEHGTTHLTREHLALMTREEYEVHVYGARLEDVVDRLRNASPCGRSGSWACHAVIVKSGDDCRQELLAMQLIRSFQAAFDAEGIPLWLRPYHVLPTSHQTALIELLPNCVSVHSIKRSLPEDTSLADHFFRMFPAGTAACEAAQKRFAQSLAAYSIVTYMLQIKDRHNGNIMMDTEGHIIHIDFGFMLSNSPGGVHFERAPFKLTAEYMHIMESDVDGRPSPCFEYFKGLCYAAYVAATKHQLRVIELVEMMQHSGCPCFAGGKRALEAFKRRFRADPIVSQQLIADSIDAWTTRQYDYYQRALNGIL